LGILSFYNNDECLPANGYYHPNITFTEKDSIEGPSGSTKVSVLSNYAFILSRTALSVVDISDKDNINENSSFSTDITDARDLFIDDNYIYIADGISKNVVIASTSSSPSHVINLGHEGLASSIEDVYAKGSYTYVVGSSNSGLDGCLFIWDLSNPDSPAGIGSLIISNPVKSVYITDSYAYLAEEIIGLRIVNIEDPANPYSIGACAVTGSALDVKVSGNYAYVTDGSGLRIININNKNDPFMEGEIETNDTGNMAYEVSLDINNNVCYLADANRIVAVDVSDPSDPSIIASYDVSGIVQGANANGGMVYLANSTGMQILQANYYLPEIITTASPAGKTLFKNNTNTVSLSSNITGTIHYTVNGDDPTTCSRVYTNPIRITQSTTLKFFTIDGYGNREQFKTEQYDIPSNITDLGSHGTSVKHDSEKNIDIAIDSYDGKPLIIFSRGGLHPTLKKWDNATTWTDFVGYPQSESTDNSIAIGKTDTRPVVSTCNNLIYYDTYIYKWDAGTDWTGLLWIPGNSSNLTNAILSIDPTEDNPVVAFREDGKLKVMKWSSGASWTDLGYVSESASAISLAIGSDGKPIVSFSDLNDSSKRARAMKWSSGTTWTDLGFVSTGSTNYHGTSIVIDASDGKPYVLFLDGYDYSVRVKKWSSGTEWVDLGSVGNGCPSVLGKHSLALNNNNKPFVVYYDQCNQYAVGLYSWDSGTTWVQNAIIKTNDDPFECSLAINSTNDIFIIYGESGSSDNVRTIRIE